MRLSLFKPFIDLQIQLIMSTRLWYTPLELVVPFHNFDEELKCPGVWETDQGATSTNDASQDNLATLYRPPFALMYHGPFEKVNCDLSW
ncbi:hypothetical protein L6452_18087 [Arctium lappa]|uniref:Uncharacterized protein n=1 Tax=Arctium lappa TaxID=4217 RepID=A0ACB9C5D6_ARCLA|nr:hypothetical protein L6452_18087 [Arctium lappa]